MLQTFQSPLGISYQLQVGTPIPNADTPCFPQLPPETLQRNCYTWA